MGDLDSLNIRLTASADQATKAIDSIITSLTSLNGALNNFGSDSKYMRGLNNLSVGLKSVRISLNGLDPAKIKSVASALDKLSTAANKLSSLTGIAPKIDSKGMERLVAASDKAIAKAKEIGGKWNFGDDEGVNRLAEAIERLYASVGDDDAVRSSMSQIEELIETYSRFENELHEVAQAENEALRSTHGRLTRDWQDVLGGDYESARRNRGKLGIANTSKSGGSASNIIGENSQLGIQESINESENLALALERIQKNAYNAAHEMVGFNEASITLTGGIEAVQAEVDELVSSLGLAADKIRDISGSTDDDFMNIDTSGMDDIWGDPAEAVQKLRDNAQEAVPAVEALDNAEKRIVQNNEQLAQVGNIFQGITTGLQSLQGITLSDSLKNIEYVKQAVGTFGGKYANGAAENLRNIAEALRGFNVTIPDYGTSIIDFANSLSKLGQKKITDAFDNLIRLKIAIEGFNGLNIDPTVTASIQQLGDGLYRFGLAKMDKAVTNIPALAQSMSTLIQSLANLPAVSENTIRLVTALGNMNVSGSALNQTLGGIGGGLKRYHTQAINARKASMSLASAFGKMYANFFIFFRLVRRFGKDIDLASQLTEIQNVVDVTFGKMSDDMNDFAKTAIETLGMGELTAKQIGSRFQAMGNAMGISPAMVKSTNEFVQKATDGYANVANSIGDVSLNLTRLAGDMASFYNMDYLEVSEDLEAVYTGITKSLRKYGLDLSVATLQQWALNNGMNVNLKTMTQAEKTLLRYQYVMAQTTAAHGDFIRTQNTWANQVRIATEKLNQLRIVLGKIAIYTFKPLVQNFNNAMDQILKGAEGLLNALGKIFGWQVEWSDGGMLKDEADDADDLADGMGDAADNAKKFKNFLLGIDELNLLPDNSDKDKGGAGGLGDLVADYGELGKFNIKPVEKGFESLYDTLYKLGKRINEVIGDLLDGIDWDTVYKKARRFGGGLADFLNGLLSNSETFYKIGRFFANGLNAIAHSLDEFHKRFDGFQFGVDIGSLLNGFMENLDWGVIQSVAVEKAHDLAQTINGAFLTIDWKMLGKTIAEGLNTAIDYFYTLGKEIKWTVIGSSIAEGINGFFANFDFVQAAETLNLWAKGLLDAIITALDRTDWEKVGKSIGDFIARIDVASIAGKLVKALWKALNGAFSAWGGLLDTAPLEAAIGTALIIPFSNNYFRQNVSRRIMDFSKLVGTSLSKDLTKVFNGSLLRNFWNGFMSAPAIGGDTFGTMFTGLTAGFNAFSASLTTATKAIGGIGVALGEFFLIKDSIYDIVMGTDNLGESIAKLVGAAGVASVALSALLGVPMGLIIAGATAGVAAIAGISKALDQISTNNVISVLSKDLGDAGTTLDEIANNFKTTADAITGGVDKMNAQHDRLSGMKTDLSEMLGGLGLIKTAAEEGTTLTSGALQELVSNLGEVKDAWEEYIKAQYDYMIQSTVNNMNFIKSQRSLTDEETKYFTDKINELTEAKYTDIKKTTTAASEAESAWKEYFDALNNTTVDHNGQKVYVDNLYELKQAALEASNELYGLGEASGLITSEEVKNLNTEMIKSKQITDNFVLSLSNIDGSDLTAYGTAVSSFNTQLQETFDNASAKVDEYKNNLSATLSPEDAEIQIKEYYAALGRELTKDAELAQAGLYDKFYSVLATGDRDAAYKYAEQVIKPFVDSFPTIIDEEGNVIKPWISDSVNKMLDADSWDWSGLFPKLKKNWQSLFYDVAPEAYKSGKNLGQKVTEGLKEETEKSAKTTSYSMGNVDRAMGDVLQSSYLLKNGMVDVNNVFKDTSKSGEGIKTISDNMTGLKNILGQFGTALLPVKTGFMEFTTQTQMGMLTTTQVFGQSFTSIMKYGNQTIAWLKSSFVPYFSGAYWSSITASIPNAFGNAFRQAVNIMTEIWKSFAKWANENMKMKVKVNGKDNADLKVEVPQYATGGFPEDGLFAANHGELVGSFANGKTAVANNDQIVEGIKQGVYEAVVSAMQGSNGNVTVELRGDASDIFTAVVRENNRSIMRTGASPIRV